MTDYRVLENYTAKMIEINNRLTLLENKILPLKEVSDDIKNEIRMFRGEYCNLQQKPTPASEKD